VEAELHGWSATWLGQPDTTWQVTDLTKSATPPWTPINTPYEWKSKEHTLLVVLHL
jgi:hypothetical protein